MRKRSSVVAPSNVTAPSATSTRTLGRFGGEGHRWSGLTLYALGGALRLAPVFVLGRRFSGLVVIQPDHRLVTGGLYSVIRHPSYLGLLMSALGWALRSARGSASSSRS